FKMTSTASWLFRATSVSSMRSTKVPPVCRAYSQLKRAVRAPPICKKPVGLGAKRTRVFIVDLATITIDAAQTLNPTARQVKLKAPKCVSRAHSRIELGQHRMECFQPRDRYAMVSRQAQRCRE